MSRDAHVALRVTTSLRFRPGAMVCSVAYAPGDLQGAACAVRGRHPQGQGCIRTAANHRRTPAALPEFTACIPTAAVPGGPARLVLVPGRCQVANMGLAANQQAGFYCKVCDCVVKDSANYLDHINGKKHQRNLGMSMRVERVTVDQVRRKFDDLKRKREEEYAAKGDLESRLEANHDEFERQERERKELKKQRRKEKERLESEGALQMSDAESSALAAMGLPTGFGGK